MSDYELVKRFLSGERDAFAEIFSRYKKLVYTTIYNFTGDSTEASDLFQEVFLRIYKALATYDPRYRFSTWAIRITTNVCLDRLRRARPELAAMDDIGEIGDDRLDPEGQCLAREREERVRKAVRELPEEYRVPVILFHQQGLSYEAMADVLGQPMTIIKNRLYRARLMLRDRLGPDGGQEASS